MPASTTRSTPARSAAPRAPQAPARRADATGRAVDGVRRLVRGLRLAEQRTRVEAGLSAAQLFVLGHLAESDASSLSALAERTMTDRSSVAAVVERLEEAGLVVSERASDDRRRVLVRITARGRRRLGTAPEAPTALLLGGLERLTSAELEGLATHLERLTEAMGLAGEPAGMLFEDGPRPRARGDA